MATPVKKPRTDPLQRMEAFSDSKEVARGLSRTANGMEFGDRYWVKEAEVHILGLWELAGELAAEVRALRKRGGANMQAELDFTERSALIEAMQQDARKKRDDGIRRAVERTESESPGWTEKAYQFLVEYSRQNERFQTWMCNQASKNGGVPIPKNEKSWAAPVRKALREGIIVKDGFAPNPRRHLTDAPVYRSLLYKSAA